MTRLILFEDAGFANLLPIVYWRSVAELQCGRFNIAQRAQRDWSQPIAGAWTRDWIADVAGERLNLPINEPAKPGDIFVNARWLADGPVEPAKAPFVGTCGNNIAYVICDDKLASRLHQGDFLDRASWADVVALAPHEQVGGQMLEYPWDVVLSSAKFLETDALDHMIGIGGTIHPTAVLINEPSIAIAESATVGPYVVIDATKGHVTIDENAKIQPHSIIEGPAHIGPNSVINPHARIHGGTSIGPVCKIGGEIDACLFQGYANKQHDGFLGHSFIGEWVNLGAGTVNSDLKNTYGSVRVPVNGVDVDTDETFFGAAIADHVKTGIGQTIGTGTVLGFAANIAHSAMMPRFIRSFTWMTDGSVEEGDAERLVKTVDIVMKRRNRALTKAERELFQKLPQIVAYFEPDTLPTHTPWETAAEAIPVPQTADPMTR